jgi:hypothetical protein
LGSQRPDKSGAGTHRCGTFFSTASRKSAPLIPLGRSTTTEIDRELGIKRNTVMEHGRKLMSTLGATPSWS